MNLSLVPRLRLALECTGCGSIADDPVLPGVIPHDPLTGRVDYPMCFELGICPMCLSHGLDLSEKQRRRILKLLRRRRR